MARPDHILITCEHGGNRIPKRYRDLFAGFESMLTSHRGYDHGALVLARELAKAMAAPVFVSTIARLLIDLNRSVGHPNLYSDITNGAPPDVRRAILDHHYLPYRNKVRAHIAAAIARGSRVIHISSHSFTPIFHGETRNADIGLLYDPSRVGEVDLCRRWQAQLKILSPEARVRRNYPYRGKSDGLTAHLRGIFPADEYVGIELEINQRWALEGGRQWRALRRMVIAALQRAMTNRA